MIEELDESAPARFPDKFRFLFSAARYKIAYGGRGSAKSQSFASALLIQAAERTLLSLCARETMKSINDSVHRLLSNQIRKLNLGHLYTVEKSRIFAANGSEFTFAGLRHNIDNIKSLEGADRVWVEEAQNVSHDSWEKLIPTVRKKGSEIWASFNPELATDATYKRFVLNPPPGAVVVRVNWQDNPWFHETELPAEMAHLKATDPDQYEHVYEGATKSAIEGAVYKAELQRAERENRITRVAIDPTRPVDTFWDLGFGDMVSIWFAQPVAFEYRIVDYYENSHQAIDFYLKELQRRGYLYGTCILPWDGATPQLQTGRSIEQLMRAAGFRVRSLPQARVHEGINAVRTLFPNFWFDGDRCADGLQGLRRYQWGPQPKSGAEKREPLHDSASHPADALRTLAMSIREPEKQIIRQREQPAPRRTYSPFG